MEFIVQETGDAGVLMIAGDLTIERAKELKQELINALRSVRHLECNLDKVTSADLSCLQLLCAAHLEASKTDRVFTLRFPRQGAFSDSVQASGFIRFKGCSPENEKTCIWAPDKFINNG